MILEWELNQLCNNSVSRNTWKPGLVASKNLTREFNHRSLYFILMIDTYNSNATILHTHNTGIV